MYFLISVSYTKKDLSHETQHVKVVDARQYESPEPLRPGTITLEFTKLLGQTPVGDKYVFDSPHSATLSCEIKSKRAKRQGRNRANRRLSVKLFFVAENLLSVNVRQKPAFTPGSAGGFALIVLKLAKDHWQTQHHYYGMKNFFSRGI